MREQEIPNLPAFAGLLWIFAWILEVVEEGHFITVLVLLQWQNRSSPLTSQPFESNNPKKHRPPHAPPIIPPPHTPPLDLTPNNPNKFLNSLEGPLPLFSLFLFGFFLNARPPPQQLLTTRF